MTVAPSSATASAAPQPQRAPRRVGRRTVRTHQWWNHKVAPLVGVAAVAIAREGRAAEGSALVDLALVLVAAAGVAAFGHVVNDWADIEVDAEAGKRNAVAVVDRATRVGLVVGCLAVAGGAWWLLGAPARATGLLLAEVVLLTLYSVPPVRLKGRGALGALADAAYAYALPFAITLTALHPQVSSAVAAAVAATGAVVGVRGILWHQREDLEGDRAAGVSTAATRLGRERLERLVANVVLPIEAVAVVAVLVALWPPAALLLAGFVAYRTFQATFLWQPPFALSSLRWREQRVQFVGYEMVNSLIEGWLPPAALVALALLGSPWWWLVLLVHVVLFRSIVRDVIGNDVWVLADGVERLAHVRSVRRGIKAVALAREADVARGPDPLADPAAQRFVFVVCGPASHVLTLRTALEHLRPVTAAEIWVLTDSRRNEVPIDTAGVDHVADVATPSELDDHQASIWLKTSVHRHLPPGEWCYLDSDIIATGPGVEGVFAERRGPVAFASDVTVRENSVDRFSPWAMTCPCLGYDDEHSCGHLREQLAVRFGLDVPGDWLHWNGGVFAFGQDSAAFLDMWHERSVASFAWPEWKTRDQGALIATVWSQGLQDAPRLSPDFNFIADLGNHDLCLDAERGWAHHPSGPWSSPRLMHLYTSPLERPGWELGRDVEAVVLRRSRPMLTHYARLAARAAVHRHTTTAASTAFWTVHDISVLWGRRIRRLPQRLTPARVWRSARARTGWGAAPSASEPVDGVSGGSGAPRG